VSESTPDGLQKIFQQASHEAAILVAHETAILRIGLVCAGSYLLHLVSVVAYPPVIYGVHLLVLPLIACGLIGFLLLALAGLSPKPSARWLILGAYLLGTVILALKWIQTSPTSGLVTLDTGLYMDFAARLLLRGENPYAWDYSGVMDLYRTSEVGGTPRLDGAMGISSYPYPALSFLLLAPFRMLHMPSAFVVSVLMLLILLVVLFLKTPRSIQPLVLLPAFAGIDFAELVSSGTMDIVWALFLVLMTLFWDKPVLRAVAFGAAAAFKQNAWLVAPFILVGLWLEDHEASESPYARVVQFLAIAGGIAVLVNLPFLIWDPASWWQGISVNVAESLALFSQGGLSSMTQIGYIYLPKSYYMFLTVAIAAYSVFVYWRHYDVVRHAFWFVPAMMLWATYRSINSYWLYWVFPGIAAIVIWFGSLEGPKESAAHRELTSVRVPGRSWRPTLIGGLILGIVLLSTGGIQAMQESRVALEIQYPVLTSKGFVDRITVTLANNGEREMSPRFSVQHQDQFLNPLSWQIDTGPPTLGPGESAVYQISAEQDSHGFLLHESAQVVASDADGDYSLRVVEPLIPDFTYLWPEAIANPTYWVWDVGRKAPTHWYLISPQENSVRVFPIQLEGKLAVGLAMDTETPGIKTASLQNQIVFQHEPFAIWLYLDPAVASATDTEYGLEFDDGERRLRILFDADQGTSRDTVPLDSATTRVARLVIPAGTWSRTEIDLPALYAEAGWDPPPLVPAVHRGVDAHFQLMQFRLLVETASQGEADLVVAFGPIEQDYRVEPQQRMAQTLDNPAGFYLRLAQTHVRDRNYRRALEAYQQALRWAPDSRDAQTGVDQVLQRLHVLESGLDRGSGP
jgi:hypothetical protein